MIQIGMCHTSESQKATQDSSDCIAWDDDAGWEEVHAQSGVNTDRAVRHVYPAILGMMYALVALMGLQLLVCLYQWMAMKPNIWIQRFVLGSTFGFWVLSVAISGISGSTTVADDQTWKYTNTCSTSQSYPGIGSILVVSFSSVVTYVAVFVVNFPEKIW